MRAGTASFVRTSSARTRAARRSCWRGSLAARARARCRNGAACGLPMSGRRAPAPAAGTKAARTAPCRPASATSISTSTWMCAKSERPCASRAPAKLVAAILRSHESRQVSARPARDPVEQEAGSAGAVERVDAAAPVRPADLLAVGDRLGPGLLTTVSRQRHVPVGTEVFGLLRPAWIWLIGAEAGLGSSIDLERADAAEEIAPADPFVVAVGDAIGV